MKFSLLSIIFAIACTSCVSGTVTEPSACDSKSLGVIPAAPFANILLPPQTLSTQFDFSSVIKKVTSISSAGSVSTNVSNLALHNASDMTWLRGVHVTIATTDNSLPEVAAAHYDAPKGITGNDVTLIIDMDSSTMLTYLQHPVTLSYTLSGMTVSEPIVLDSTMCVAVVGAAKL